MADPWLFGWNQLLTIVGFIITSVIATSGFRTFNRWKREQIEERRIETAIEALSLAYESKYIFDAIRSPMSFGYEWKDMPKEPVETDAQWDKRGPFYAIARRERIFLSGRLNFNPNVWRCSEKKLKKSFY